MGLALGLVLLLVPYLFAGLTGSPAEATAGLARFHSAAESVYCRPGFSPVTGLLLAELGLLAAGLAAASAGRRVGRLGLALRANGWLLVVVLALAALPFVLGWRTDSSVCERGQAFFWQAVLVDLFTLAILAISYNLMFGFTGVVSFGHAAFFGLGAYGVGLLMERAQWPWWLAVLGALLLGVVVALVKGVVGLRIKGLYFALFTLALAQVFYLLAGNRLLAGVTGAEDGFTFSVPDFLNITRNRLFFYLLALGLMVLAYVLVQRLMHSPTGRVLSALRDNEARAQMLGYNTFLFKLIAIVLAGLMATGAGVLRGLALKGASPDTLSLDYTMTPLLMTIIGGAGTFQGPVVGAFGLYLTERALRDTVVTLGEVEVNIGERWTLILGVIFILSVIIFPHGIVGTVQRWWGRWRALRAAPPLPVESGQSAQVGPPAPGLD
jgi:branched-chain amino acid transport system permease protein